MDAIESENLSEHLLELNSLLMRASIALVLISILWSPFIDNLIQIWIENLPIQTGPSNENMSVFGPYEWIQVRWGLLLLLSLTTLLPLLSIQIYRFSRPGLYPSEKNWLSSVLLLTTTIIPFAIYSIWHWGLPFLFDFATRYGTPDGVFVRYDAPSIFSLAIGISWVLIIWSVTTISLSLTRVFGLLEEGTSRFRFRLIAISASILVLTLPVEFDGLRMITAFLVVYSSDIISKSAPVAFPSGQILPNDTRT